MVQSGSHYKEQEKWNNMAENKDFGRGRWVREILK
jgi:hypothetical protein